jgi:hypothetical protein
MVRLVQPTGRWAAILVAGCLILGAFAAKAQAVNGDQVASPAAYSFVAKVNFGPAGEIGSLGCSGALVQPQYVITAKKCFVTADPMARPADRLPSLPSSVTFPSGAPGQGSQTINVMNVAIKGDALLLMLAEAPAGIVPVPGLESNIGVDEIVRVVGYGRTFDEWAPLVAHSTQFVVKNANPVQVVASDPADAGVCPGDAGAPVLREVSGEIFMVGIVTGGGSKGCYKSLSDSNQASVVRTDGYVARFDKVFIADFEKPEVAPLISTPYSATTVVDIGGYCCSVPGPRVVVSEERSAVAASRGPRSLLLEGRDNSATKSFAYMKAFGTSIPVDKDTVLSYWVYPESSAGTTGKNSSCVAVDLVFAGGKTLRASGLKDQKNVLVHPAKQCGTLTMNAWNQVRVGVGRYAAGLRINSILVGYDQPAGTGGFRAFIDDIEIGYGFTPCGSDVCASVVSK